MTLTSLLHHNDDPGDDTLAGAAEEPQAPREETAAQPAASPADCPVTPDGGRPVSPLRQVWLAVRYAAHTGSRQWRDACAREGGWVGAALAGRPRSVRGQQDHLRNRRWLHDGHEGGIADRTGEAFHVAIGVPGVAAGNLISWVCAGMIQFTVALAVFLGAVFAVTQWAGLTPAAGLAAVAVIFSAVAGYVGLIALLLAARRAIAARLAGRFQRH